MARRRRPPAPQGPPPATWPPAELIDPDPAAWPNLDALLDARADWQRDHRLPDELIVPWREATVQDSWSAVTRRRGAEGPRR